MSQIDLARLAGYRIQTFRLPPGPRLTDPASALDFVDERGFVYFWPIKGVDLPNLWVGVAGERPVADAHDDPGHITWGWKDNALDKKIWYYAKVLRRKATIISLATLPYFYALSENYGDPDEDYLLAYEEGRLTQAAKQVFEALLQEGRLNTIDLRRVARLTSSSSTSEFNRALETLQADFKVLPVGVSDAGAWHYSHIYDLTARQYPDLSERARPIGEGEARRQLLKLYLRSVGATQARDVERLFGWGGPATGRTISALEGAGMLAKSVHSEKAGEWLALSDVLAQH